MTTAPRSTDDAVEAPVVDPPMFRVLRDRFGEVARAHSTFRDTLIIDVERDRSHEVLEFLRTAPATAFDMLLDIATVDWLDYEGTGREPRFDVIYNLLSIARSDRLLVRVSLSEDDPRLPTVTDIWVGANWFEREAFDLMGITFEGHPNLTRILTHGGFKGHPLRKDYAADKRQPTAAPPTVVSHESDPASGGSHA